eukprot:GFYU01002327.1.p1 GENE.GFYU01002327.1~~GFYU01002327.1.p1  ORF type:complete len:763 (-),score=200.01 GFYU01002327.1:142-2430(-)
MKLKCVQAPRNIHKEIVTCVGWTAANELFSVSDDNTIYKWNIEGESQGKVCDMEVYCTDMHWYPASSRRQQNAPEMFVVACTDGTFKMMNKAGRVDKSIDNAHNGAVCAVRWSYDGAALVTGGEDGCVKVWSKKGMARPTIAQTDHSVYTVGWSPDSNQVFFSSGKNLIIKPLQPSSKQLLWKAHNGTVLTAEWNPINGMIVSGGEDRVYKVWDSYGRLMFQSQAVEYSITSVAWSPNGEMFAVGSYDMIRVCDKTGWAYSREQPESGSIMNLAWTSDGTQLSGAGANGAVVFGHIIERKLEWKHLQVTLVDNHHVHVYDVLSENKEELDFKDLVVKMSVGHGYLIVVTGTQCYIYAENSWSTPHIFDVKETVTLLVQSERHFLMVDNYFGIQVFSYEGRALCNPKFSGIRSEFLNHQSVALSDDCLAVIDKTDSSVVRLFDPSNGRPFPEVIQHSLEVQEIALDQYGSSADRKLVLIDKNRDLYISPTSRADIVKLGAMTDSVMFNDRTGMLCALMDNKFVTWYYPNVAYVDRDLMELTKVEVDAREFKKEPQILSFFGTLVSVRRSDGALSNTSISPHPLILYDQVDRGEWDQALKLCRHVKDRTLWACLAGMALNSKELSKAEVAFAEIEEVDKLYLILHIKDIPTAEGRNAELALLRRRPEEAEAILMQAGLIYRAIKMHIRLFNWDRALDIAWQHKSHVDTVLAYRQKYLDALGKQENNERFLQVPAELASDWETIQTKIREEKIAEAERPGAMRLN